MENLELFDFISEDIDIWSPCPVHIHRKMIQVGQEIERNVAVGIELKIGPLLDKIVELGPGKYHLHPSINKVFKWLMDPQRTAIEFNYVVGPFGKYKFDLTGRFKNLYLGLIAAEALAARDASLKGPWEHAGWFVVWLNKEYCREYNYGIASNNLSDWIIRIMGDPDLCPNHSLRLELMNMFGRMISVKAENGSKAFNAVMTSCYPLPEKDQDFFVFLFGEIKLSSMTNMLEKFIPGGFFSAMDQSIVHMVESRVSSIISDMACTYGMNPNRYTGPKEATMVKWFFHITLLYAYVDYEKFKTVHFYPEQEYDMEDITNTLLVLVTNFKKSCQSPRIIDMTANCVLHVMELVLRVNIARMNEFGNVYPKTLYIMHKVILALCDEAFGCNIVLSPVGQILQIRYQSRLSDLREALGKYKPDSDMICSILYHCNFIE